MKTKTTIIKAVLFFACLFFAGQVNAQLAPASYTNSWPNLYSIDAIQFGAGSQLFIGGRNTAAPICWSAYPGDNTNHGSRYRYTSGTGAGAASQIIFEPWGERMRFQLSADHATSTSGNLVTLSDVLVLQNNGNVGIGMVNPFYKLDVCGDMRAKKLRIEAGTWCDYVFAPDYKLITLFEVEDYIKKYKHLPDVPSEQEVKENGIDVGEMQAVLLKKIEELTLYMIQLQKDNEALKAEVEVLKNK